MRQKVTVISCADDRARVRYRRPTACHGDCDSCGGGCASMAAGEEIVVEAENLIGAQPGDRVLIEGSSKKVAWAIALVYVLPVVLFFLGYYLGWRLWDAGTVVGIIGFFLGLGLAVLASFLQKKRGREIQYQVVAFAQDDE